MKKTVYVKHETTRPFVYEYEYVLSPRKTITIGDKFKVKGERGWFKFLSITYNPDIDKSWVDCKDKDGKFRAFRPERIKGVPPKRRNGVKKHDE